MNDYERRSLEDFENELKYLRDSIADEPSHIWQAVSIDRKIFLIGCRISWLQASRAQCWAESKTLIRIITLKRSQLIGKANELSLEIDQLLEIQTEYQDLKHELMTHVNQRLHTGS